jgi:putative transposase
VVSTPEEDAVTRRSRAQQVALFRYQLICPALEAGLSTKARGRIVRAIAAKSHAGPFGGQHRYSRDSLDRWIRRYRAGGFDALLPSPRQPGSRIDTGVLELASALKRENPERTAAQVARILRASSGYSPSESTLLRLFHRRELMGPAAGDQPVAFGRFEAAAPNERWVGDALHGPRIGGRKTYLFAFLDDHSAPRGASLYPRFSREQFGGRLLGPMAYLNPKGAGNNSMPGKRRSCLGVERGAAGPARYG